MLTYVYIDIHVCVYICMCIHICICIYIYIYMYIPRAPSRPAASDRGKRVRRGDDTANFQTKNL